MFVRTRHVLPGSDGARSEMAPGAPSFKRRQENSMNPFLHNPVASRATLPSLPETHGRRATIASRRRNWSRALGSLALATGMSLVSAPAQALDVNSATAEQLASVRGLGPRTAAIIVKERERGGRFESMEDLSDRVRGIGQRKAQALQAAGLRVEGQAAAAHGNAAAPPAGKPAAKADGKADGRQPLRQGVANGLAPGRRSAP
jgi:competence protein ComEA